MAECPDRETLQAFLGEDLAQEDLASVSRHVEVCEACQALLELISDSQTVVPASTQWQWTSNPPEMISGLQEVVSRLKNLTPTAGAVPVETIDLSRLALVSPPDDPQFLGMIGKYGLVEVLGRGGMGIVLKAVDTALDRTVAIKTLLPDPPPSNEAKERFMREARSAAALRHDHVVTIHAVEALDGIPYIVMEYVHGPSVAQRIAREGRLPPDEVSRLGAQAAAGLAAAHEKGLIHRDIKPANLLIDDESGRLKLTDFGLAKLSDDTSITQSGVVAGTPEFMAPEQADGRPVDHRADLFSLGTVLYAGLTGKSPFAATTTLEALRRVREVDAPPIREVCPEAPPLLADIIDQLMAKTPEHRIQSAAEVAELLAPNRSVATIVSTGGGATVRARANSSRSRRIRVGWIAAAATVLVAVLAYWLWPDPPSPPPGDSLPSRGFRILGKAPIHATLNAAVASAVGGDVIEVFGNEPHYFEPIQILGKPLTIRAADGHLPILSHPLLKETKQLPAIETDSKLVLEGLEVRWKFGPRTGRDADDGELGRSRCMVLCYSGELYALNCRFHVSRRSMCIGLEDADARLVSCHLAAENGVAIAWQAAARKRLELNNVRIESRNGILVRSGSEFEAFAPAELAATQCSFQTEHALRWMDVAGPQQRVLCQLQSCLIQSAYLHVITTGRRPFAARQQTLRNIRQGLFRWTEADNVYSNACQIVATTRLRANEPQVPEEGEYDLAAWLQFWGLNRTASVQLGEGKEPAATAGVDEARLGPGEAYRRFRASAAYDGWMDD